jgi:hypothetical protein
MYYLINEEGWKVSVDEKSKDFYVIRMEYVHHSKAYGVTLNAVAHSEKDIGLVTKLLRERLDKKVEFVRNQVPTGKNMWWHFG